MLRKIILMLALAAGLSAASLPVTIKMGTLAPEGSPWYDVLMRVRERWRDITGGRVKLVLYPGGALGDEPDLVNKMRINQIQAVALSGAGMQDIDKGVACLQIPMMFDSYAELDYVRDRIAPRLEKIIEARGFLVLNWGDAGWVYFFTKTPAVRLDDLRRLKLFTWAGYDDELQLWKANGFRPVPLAATDILTGLQTGLIEAVPTTPLYALWNQSFALTRYMNDIKWAPLVGATIVKKSAWEQVPPEYREAMLKIAHDAGQDLRGGIRQMGDDSIATMQKRRLTVVHADERVTAEWRKEAENVYPTLRGKTVPADLFDEVKRLRDEFRAHGGTH
ncbi:MAG TPA: TRAP transporter substrate-binding protein DctP [Bryobacteraceae bacterium]|nr:TRAP transporter substrate-binding protein DctP [Bryobacteraceae bacterium]